MATLHFTKKETSYNVAILGKATRSTIKILNNYIERKKLNVQSTTVQHSQPLFI